MKKRRIHDGIVGLVVTGGCLLAYHVNSTWIWVPVVLGVLLIISGITGFCPLYWLLDRTCKE